MTFEENLKKLETLVAEMESGRLDLDAMIAAFENGRKLVKECHRELKAVQLKIEKVTKSGETEELKV